MDGGSIFFVFLMVFIGGLTAFLADMYGYKIGKKRLSFLHLRPKYVARLSVTVAGFLIPLITVGIFYAVSQEFRIWLTRGGRVVKELQSKSEELRKVSGNLDTERKLVIDARQENNKLSKALGGNKKLVDEQVKKLAELNRSFADQRQQYLRVQEQVRNVQARVANLNAQNASSRALLAGSQKKLAEVSKTLSSSQVNLERANTEYQAAVASITDTNKKNLELIKANQDLNRDATELKRSLLELRESSRSLREEVRVLAEEKKISAEDAAQAQLQLKTLQGNVEQYVTILSEYQQRGTEFEYLARLGGITFLRGEEIARVEIPKTLKIADAELLYISFLRQCRTIAAARGAKESPSYPFTGAAGVVGIDKNQRAIPENEASKLIVEEISRKTDSSVLIARASNNRFIGEPVVLELTFDRNPVVLAAGEVIAEIKVDGRQSYSDLYLQVRDFVRSFVNTRARKLKMIPVQTRDGESFGEISAKDVIDTILNLRETPRIVRLQAVSRTAVRAADTLSFDLVVK